MTPKELLDLPLDDNDSGATTVRGYFAALLTELWREEEGFDGKRPFGNSGWQQDIYRAMAKAGLMQSEWLDQIPANNLILDAIALLCEPK